MFDVSTEPRASLMRLYSVCVCVCQVQVFAIWGMSVRVGVNGVRTVCLSVCLSVSLCSEHVYMAELGRVEKFLPYQCQKDTCIRHTHFLIKLFILL